MKRRVETRLEWKYADPLTSLQKGIATTLPPPKRDKVFGPIRIQSVSVQSDQRDKLHPSGYIQVEFDRVYEYRDEGGFDRASVLLVELSRKLYDSKTIKGSIGFGGYGFSMDFELREKHKGFCEEAIERVLAVLEGVGVQKNEIGVPKITQRTLVWIPENNPLRGNHIHKWGWIEYGVFLGDLYGLSGEMKHKLS